MSKRKRNVEGENRLVVEQANLATVNNDIVKNTTNNKVSNSIVRDRISIILKRGIDLASGIVGCLLLVPITLFVVISNIVNRDKGPIFFTQERIGKKRKNI
ncbi:MAG: sugar transferase [Clostridia bacterium]|nr:sugar transferase [Clostridia bacterium]